jgi:hypothetical protein
MVVDVLQINKTKLIGDIFKMLDKEMNKVSNTLIQYMISEINDIPIRGSVEAVGKPDWRLDVIDALRYVSKNEAMKSINKDIGLINQSDDNVMKAMIINYGMGDLADTWTNPWIDEYYQSEFYHQERGGMDVYGREGKEVYDIDDNAWNESTANHSERIPHFHQIGSNFWDKVFGNSSKLAYTEFQQAIDRVFDSIDINKYLFNKK